MFCSLTLAFIWSLVASPACRFILAFESYHQLWYFVLSRIKIHVSKKKENEHTLTVLVDLWLYLTTPTPINYIQVIQWVIGFEVRQSTFPYILGWGSFHYKGHSNQGY